MLSFALALAGASARPNPAVMIVSNYHGITTIPYKSMQACERARSYVAGPPAGSRAPDGAIYGAPAIIYRCVPR
jgi:hypothetical protein